MQTHETYVLAVAEAAIAFARQNSGLTSDETTILQAVKLTYGAGPNGVRGVTYYGRWNTGSQALAVPFVEISAFNQSNWIQLAGTTIHELAHVLAGAAAGHNKAWKEACARLGLRRVLAGGTDYKLANFACTLRFQIAGFARPDDGEPVSNLLAMPGHNLRLKGCATGIGTRGGKSRGVGSGSRLRLFECECVPPVKVRLAHDNFAATHHTCGCDFHRVEAPA